ncbi:MAG TPA: DnaJ domain-containing protein, partial [Actinopolymorphaceae bacterium]
MPASYYDLLELPTSASEDDIRAAIRQQRRLWVRRQSSPDPARRSEAEQRVRDLDQAERTLLDPTARAEYDRTLAGVTPI